MLNYVRAFACLQFVYTVARYREWIMVDFKELETAIRAKIALAGNLKDLDAVRIEFFGKKGVVSEQLRALGKLSPDERQSRGSYLNELKTAMHSLLAEKQVELEDAALAATLAEQAMDISLPIADSAIIRGRIHPISQTIQEIKTIFAKFGFSVASGPDIETDYYNFTALNFPVGHPAREMHDSFFLPNAESGEMRLLRTHTSPVQIRTMEQQEPPIRIIIPGKTYRVDSDATHSPMFHQLEGLVIDKSTNLAQMKWLLEEFCKEFFEVKSLKMRFRPSFFPFTEPSMEVDIQCDRSSKNGILIGSGNDWMEILGCGMVHPNVLRNCNLDPDIYQGFAWGIGIDRLAMLKYGMPDLRAFFSSDVRWLSHYGFKAYEIPQILVKS